MGKPRCANGIHHVNDKAKCIRRSGWVGAHCSKKCVCGKKTIKLDTTCGDHEGNEKPDKKTRCGEIRGVHRVHEARNWSMGTSWGKKIWYVTANCGKKAKLPRGQERRPPETFKK